MGQISFATPRPDRISSAAIEQCYLAGMEGIPWACRNHVDDDVLTIQRQMNESGGLHIPWNLNGAGDLMLSTASLVERDDPYHLHVELARGTLNRFRNYIELGRMLQFPVPESVDRLMAEATTGMIDAAIGADLEKATENADLVIDRASAGIRGTCVAFARQLIAQRCRQQPLATLWGGRIDERMVDGQHDELLPACNSAALTFPWRQLEPNSGEHQWEAQDEQIRYCRKHHLKTFAGPLLRFDRSNLPDWTYLWEEDFDTLRSLAREHINRVVQRFQGQVDIWHAASGLNVSKLIRLTEEQRLRLTLDCLEAVRGADPRTPVVVSFTQPWAEYMSNEDAEMSPLHFADNLVRSGIGVAAVGLEIDWGYRPTGTICRDLLELSYHVDRWSTLGLPIIIYLTVPTSNAPDDSALMSEPVVANHPAVVGGDKYYEEMLTVLLAKPAVQGLLWNQATDEGAHELPNGGMFDADGAAKPIVGTLANLRQAFQLS